MILIEVIFGAINGNPISIDSALDTTSTNPVENRVIAAELAEIMNEIYHVQDELDDKEVVDFQTKDALDAYIQDLIDDEDQEAIEEAQDKLYYAADLNQLYKFDGTELHPVESGYIIVSGTQTDLNTALAAYTTRGIRKVIWINGSTTTLYIFTTEGTTKKLTQTLTYKTGYKTRTCSNPTATTPTWGAWTTKTYSFTGHTHTSANITDLSTTIATAVAGKQDSTPAAGTLNTTATTIVGAINELKAKTDATFHAFTIDFQDAREVVQQRAVGGSFTITKISTDNVATLTLFVNGTQQTITLSNGVWTGELAIPADALLVWGIARTTEGQIAEINIKFNY